MNKKNKKEIAEVSVYKKTLDPVSLYKLLQIPLSTSSAAKRTLHRSECFSELAVECVLLFFVLFLKIAISVYELDYE